MKDLIKNNWINGLGILFIFTAFLYFLKVAIDYGWFPPEVRAASGLAIGASSLFIGFKLYKKNNNPFSEIVSGLGIATIFATLSYISFSESISWSHNAMLISTIALSAFTSYFAVKMNMRILYITATIGALITPLVLKASDTQDLMLFIYLLVINISVLYISATKKWHELKIISFISSILIYTTYYILFDPIQWGRPFFYISSFFLVYTISSVIETWKSDKNELGLNQYLDLMNAINFVFWSNFILTQFDIPHTLPMIIVGVIFLSIGSLKYFLKDKKLELGNSAYLSLGIIVMAIACSDTGLLLTNGINYVVNSAIWLILILALFIFGKQLKNFPIILTAYGSFLVLVIYWYVVSWDVEWISVFGIKYIPFLNLGALIWIGLAFLGFYFSKFESNHELTSNYFDKKTLSTLLATLGHIIVGGLLTVQIVNLWTAYDISFIKLHLATSICWIIYALTIYLWSNYSNNKIFKYLGGAVLGITSLKIFIFDLSGTATFQKVIFLAIVGVLILIIGKIDTKKVS